MVGLARRFSEVRPALRVAAGVIAVLGGVVGGHLVASSSEMATEELASSVSDLEVSEPTLLCVGEVTSDCRTAESVEAILRSGELEPEGAALPASGTQGAIVLSLEGPEDQDILAKWRVLTDDLINDPAKGLAAYETQRLLIDPRDYVIPPTAGHCFEPQDLEEAMGVSEWNTLEGTSCVFGFLSYWLVDAIDVDTARREGHHPGGEPGERDPKLFLPGRFESNPTYRRNIAILNTLMFLVDNGDLHAGQFVLYPEAGHWFVVDSSIAFESLDNPTLLFAQDLSELHVPSIPATLANRLRSIDRAEVEALAVLEEYVVEDGSLVRVEPGGEVIGDPDDRLRRVGDRVQIGMRPAEIDGLWRRVENLRRRLDDTRLGTF